MLRLTVVRTNPLDTVWMRLIFNWALMDCNYPLLSDNLVVSKAKSTCLCCRSHEYLCIFPKCLRIAQSFAYLLQKGRVKVLVIESYYFPREDFGLAKCDFGYFFPHNYNEIKLCIKWEVV